MDNKTLNNDELNKVNGGATAGNNMVQCPECGKKFNGDLYQVTYGSGCHEKRYWKCPDCGHEW